MTPTDTPTPEELAAWEAETQPCEFCAEWNKRCLDCGFTGRVPAHPALPVLVRTLREAQAEADGQRAWKESANAACNRATRRADGAEEGLRETRAMLVAAEKREADLRAEAEHLRAEVNSNAANAIGTLEALRAARADVLDREARLRDLQDRYDAMRGTSLTLAVSCGCDAAGAERALAEARREGEKAMRERAAGVADAWHSPTVAADIRALPTDAPPGAKETP
jgi:hypothetical protein